MARALRGDHADDDVLGRLDQAEVDVEAVAEQQSVTVVEVRLDVVLVDLLLGGVRGEQHDDVGPCGGVGVVLDLEAGLLGLLRGLGAVAQTDADLDAGVTQVLGVGVALGAVADDGDLAALDEGEVSVGVVKQFNSHGRKSRLSSYTGADVVCTTT